MRLYLKTEPTGRFAQKVRSIMQQMQAAGAIQKDKSRKRYLPCVVPCVRLVLALEWLGGRDSNPDTQIQSLQSYR